MCDILYAIFRNVNLIMSVDSENILNIFISATLSFCSCLFFIAQHSDEYIIAGLTTVLTLQLQWHPFSTQNSTCLPPLTPSCLHFLSTSLSSSPPFSTYP